MGEIAAGHRLDRFEIDGVLAKSGMGTVYRARDTESGAPVVVKVPHLEYASDIVFHERFRREEDIGQRLSHPGIARVLQVPEKSRLYLAMELVEGESLRSRLDREGRLPVAEALRLGIAIADVLEYLHEHGVVHRDLKPENVMLLPGGGLKLLDFGIALDTTQRKIEWAGLSSAVGTPDYMAPEQIRSRPGDGRTDLYALGVILYEMLTGGPPFTGDAATNAKLHEDAPPLRAKRPEVPPSVERVVMRALAREPEDRPERALEMRDALAFPESTVVEVQGRASGLEARLGRRGVLVVGALAAAVYAVLFWVLVHRGGR
jgi:serine/threonine protein kinase